MDDVLNSGIVNNDSVNSDNNVNNKESNTTNNADNENEGIDLINIYWSDDGHFESHNDKKDDI